jgi:diaminopimelate decarboxylase
MDNFAYRNGQLYCEEVNLDELASNVGTPAYVYSRATFEGHFKRLREAFAELEPTLCYSIKSCGNIHILKLLADMGSGMDVVSGGELYRAQQAGADMSKVVYAGVGKTDSEIRQALDAKIGYFNIESEAEFENIATIARKMGVTAKAALRVNPDVADPKTHAKTATGKKQTKFGVDIERAKHFFERFGREKHLKPCAIHLHIGSPIYSAEPYVKAIEKALALIDDVRAAGCEIEALDIGGGFAADYESDQSPLASDYAKAIVPLLREFHQQGGKVILEPGRTIAANAGVLLTRVQYIKMGGLKKFIIIDSGMHHLIRPTLYDSFHFLWPTNVAPMHEPKQRRRDMDMPGLDSCDVVGPICESGDYLAKDRPLPPVARGDLLAVFAAGAYGMVMASHYNAMPKPVEVLISDDHARIIRRRETYDDLIGPERDVTTV